MMYVSMQALSMVLIEIIHPVPEEMRLEIINGTEIRIVNTQVLGLFSNVTFEKRPRSMGLENGYRDGNQNCKCKRSGSLFKYDI